jgi:hypothetical protein
LGELKLSKPIAWQEKDGKKLPVEVSYKLIGKNRYSFVVAKADPSLPIVIDPILQSTYLGGSDDDFANALAIHPTTGEVYVAGGPFPTTFLKLLVERRRGATIVLMTLKTPVVTSLWRG